MRLKKIIAASVICLVTAVPFFGTPLKAEAAGINIQINGQVYTDSSVPSPENINNRVYVPLRVVSEGLGHTVQWDGTSRSVLIDSQLTAINSSTSTLNSLQIYIKNKLIRADYNHGIPYISPAGYTMVPVRIVAENLGADVNWSGTTQTVVISTKGNSSSDSTVTTPIITVPSVSGGNNSNNNGVNGGNTVTSGTTAATTTLAGKSVASLEQMKRYISQKEASVKAASMTNGRTFVPFPTNIAEYYYTIGQKYNIRGDVALAQALHETGNFQYGNEVKAWQNNYCGLGAIGYPTTEEDLIKQQFSAVNSERAYLVVGLNGWVYADVASGVEAHIQHLYSYAYANALPAGVDLLDGRFAHGNRGKATYLTDLNGKWAVPGNNYGEIIYKNYLLPILNS